MRRHSQGFSPLEIILAIAVIGLIGAVAWMFISNQKSKDANDQSASSAVDKKTESKKSDNAKDRSADWLTWQPSGKQYSIKLADGWKVHLKQGVKASFYVVDGIELNQGQRATVHDSTGNMSPCDGAVLDYMDYTYPAKWYTGKEETFKTDSGLEVKKSISLPSDGSQGIPSTDTSYHYVISTTGKSVMISYTKCEKSTDHHELFEQVVKTFKF